MFPVQIKKDSQSELNDRLKYEDFGQSFTTFDRTGDGSSGIGLWDFGAFYLAAMPSTNSNRAALIKKIVITTNQNCILQFQGFGHINGIGATANSGDYTRKVMFAGQDYVIDCNDLYHKSTPFQLSVREMLTAAPGTDRIRISVVAHYKIVDIDYFLNADKWILVVGTSLSAGTGATDVVGSATVPAVPAIGNHYIGLLTKWLHDVKGYRIKVVNKSVSSSWSVQHESKRMYPYCRYSGFETPPSLVIYEQGGNDYGQGVSTAQFVANALKFCVHKQVEWPDAKMLVLAPFPYGLNYPTGETAIVAQRTALAAMITTLADPDVMYVPGTGNNTAYTWNVAVPADITAYQPDSTHPNNAGYLKIYNAIEAFWTANDITL